MNIHDILLRSEPFHDAIALRRESLVPPPNGWYPYDILGNLGQLDVMLRDPYRDIAMLAGGMPVADIGGADGDWAFYLETLGFRAEMIDCAHTNYNGLVGARALRMSMGSQVAIHDIDMDSAFKLPQSSYGLVFFLGILYHLKNPYQALERLAAYARYCILSTRVAAFTTDHAISLHDYPLAYLLHETECNNDHTNYWIFSPAGLDRIFDRTGWMVRNEMLVGNMERSDPATKAGDQRAYVLLESKRFCGASNEYH